MTPRTFIIRPFGEKKGFDFDRVERELIGPALDAHGISDRTTLDILRSGNIRTDMFHRLLTADLVIADISIHNANVFYELGIRHALRRRHTILIRNEESKDDVPFDLFTDRFLSYKGTDLNAALNLLTESIDQTLDQKEEEDTDSPVFLLLPQLDEQNAESFITVPRAFTEQVEIYADSKEDTPTKIADLALLGREIQGLPWEVGGQRLIGNAQFKLHKGAPAIETWERVCLANPTDIEANQYLSTLYQREGQLTESDQAIERVLSRKNVPVRQRAEAMALRGRNAKSRWLDRWRGLQDAPQRQRTALNASELRESCECYYDAYLTDLSHFYSGINALAMMVVVTELAKIHPDVWANSFEKEEEAPMELQRLGRLRSELETTVGVSIDAFRRAKGGESDLWDDVTQGDLAFLRGRTADRVKALYTRVGNRITPFQVGSVRDQLEMFRTLGVLEECATAALGVLPQPQSSGSAPPHMLVFTGHRVDAPGRKKPRFPASAVETAKAEIEAAIDDEVTRHGSNLVGIAGAASGGDILFHEALMRRGIKSLIYLALPPEEFVAESVKDAGPDWVKRFYDLVKARPPRILQKTSEAPEWLPAKKDDPYYIWNRNNLWILNRGLVNGGANMTLLALWNGEAGDGPGGTEDMVKQAETRGARIVRIGQGTIFPGV